jgi:hypothetical protein
MAERRIRFVHVVVALLIVTIVVLGLTVYRLHQLSSALVAGMCGVAVGRIVPAPDASMVLVSYVVDCGATTAASTQASLVPSGARFSRKTYPRFVAIEGVHDLAGRWLDSRTVEISIPTGVKVYDKRSFDQKVTVKYK